MSDAELESQTSYLTDRLEELRRLIGTAWRELQCVRAGDAYKRRGKVIQKVEQVVGSTTPFRQAELQVGEMMERDELYLCRDGAAQPLRLLHFVVLRGAPGDPHFTCYFYNRRDGSRVELVAYQRADNSRLVEDIAGFADAIEGWVDAGDMRS